MPPQLKEKIFQMNIIGFTTFSNCWQPDQVAIYKHDQGVELVSGKKQLQLSGQRGT